MRTVVVYDLVLCPDGIEMDRIIDTYLKHGFILYVGKDGKEPKVITLTRVSFFNRIKLLWFKISKYFSRKLTKN